METETRICKKCGKVKLLNKEFWYSQHNGYGFRWECKTCYKSSRSKERINNPLQHNKYNHTSEKKLRLAALHHYSGSIPKCCCCEEANLEFLAIDHVDGGGGKHRREARISKISRWLRDNNYPEGFRVLCHNCNSSIGFYGYCPHQSPELSASLKKIKP